MSSLPISLIDKIMTYNIHPVAEIVKKAMIIAQPIRDQMIAKYKQNKKNKRLQEEVSKARIIARAIVLAQAESGKNNISIAGLDSGLDSGLNSGLDSGSGAVDNRD